MNTDEKSIYNLLIQDIGQVDLSETQWISVGVHPWYADETNWEKQLLKVQEWAMSSQVVAIGECGLDRLITLPLKKQLLIFEAQVILAEQLQKPVIIHCVKAFNELLYWKKQRKVTVPLIVHGFNNKPEIARQLLAHGFYLSLGTPLLRSNSNATKVLREIPIERLFLENDNRQTPIFELYQIAAMKLDTTVLAIKNQLWHNFELVFGSNVKFA